MMEVPTYQRRYGIAGSIPDAKATGQAGEARGMAQEGKYGKLGVVPEEAAPQTEVIVPLRPESQFAKEEFAQRFAPPTIRRFKDQDVIGRIDDQTASEINQFGFNTKSSDVTIPQRTIDYIEKNHGRQLGKEDIDFLDKVISEQPEVLPSISTENAPQRAKSVLLVKENGKDYVAIVEILPGETDNVLWNYWKMDKAKANRWLQKYRDHKKQLVQPGGATNVPSYSSLPPEGSVGKPEGLSGSQVGPKPEQSITLPGDKVKPPEGEGGTTLFGGFPIQEFAKQIGEGWQKYVGEPIWDKLIMEKVPQLLEKIPGGKNVNRAMIYGYKGDLPGAADYMASFEDMKRWQAVGREYAIDLGKRLQDMPEMRQAAIGEYIRGEKQGHLAQNELRLADESSWAFLELGKQAVDLGLLSDEVFFKNAGKYMPRLYTSKEYQGLLARFGITKPDRLDLSRFQKRKDIPKQIREQMGEILTPGYPVAKGIIQLTHDIEMARFFKGISDKPEWSWKGKTFDVLAADPDAKTWGVWEGDQVRGVFNTRKDALAEKKNLEQQWNANNPVPAGFQQLPKSPKLGALSEAHVHPEIYSDLMDAIHVASQGEKV